MLKNILGALAALVVIAIALGFVLPDSVHVERDIVINAPAEEVYALAADLNEWDRWSPWAERDSAMTTHIEGAGVGQTMTWDSKTEGAGRQEVTALEPGRSIATHLEFAGMGMADATMTLEPVTEGTHVVWSFDSNMRAGHPLWMQPLATYMGFFMDGLLGKDYEAGLARLKAVAEAAG